MKSLLFCLLFAVCGHVSAQSIETPAMLTSSRNASVEAGMNESACYDSMIFYRTECQRLRVKVQLAQQNVLWMDRFVNIVANNPSQAKFVKGWANRVKAAKLFPDPAPVKKKP